jgi:hypothetical protein
MKFLTDLEFVRKYGAIYNELLEVRNNSDYIVNNEQMQHFLDMIAFFRDLQSQIGGEIQPIKIEPKQESGGFTAEFSVFDIYLEQVKRFCEVLQYASAVSIDGDDGRVFISVTVPNIYRKK